jgi:hypothetical protein
MALKFVLHWAQRILTKTDSAPRQKGIMTFHFAGKTHTLSVFQSASRAFIDPDTHKRSIEWAKPLQSSWLHDILSSVNLKPKSMPSTPKQWSIITLREPALRSQKLEKLTGNIKAGVSVNYIYSVSSMLGKQL